MTNTTEEEPVVLRFTFNDDTGGKIFQLDLGDLTTEEQIRTEEFFDMPLERAISSGWLLNSTKGLVWLAYLARFREEPEFTYQDAARAFKELKDEDESSVPTEASTETGTHS